MITNNIKVTFSIIGELKKLLNIKSKAIHQIFYFDLKDRVTFLKRGKK